MKVPLAVVLAAVALLAVLSSDFLNSEESLEQSPHPPRVWQCELLTSKGGDTFSLYGFLVDKGGQEVPVVNSVEIYEVTEAAGLARSVITSSVVYRVENVGVVGEDIWLDVHLRTNTVVTLKFEEVVDQLRENCQI